jgi:hypothetical protein
MTRPLLMTAFSLATAAAQVQPGTGREDGVVPVLSHPLGGRAVGLVHLFGGGISWHLPAAFLRLMFFVAKMPVDGSVTGSALRFVLPTALLNDAGRAPGAGIAAIGG